MIKTLFVALGLFVNFLTAQNISKQKTIDYINANYSDGLKVDQLGNITLAGKYKFSYRNVQLSPNNEKTFTGKINFFCVNKDNCIERKEGDVMQKMFNYTIKINDKENFARLYNAFDHLLSLLEKEKPDNQDKDPFAPQNYKKN